WIGGIPVNRDKHSSMVEQIIYKIKNSQTFHLAITPEGTRSPNPNWKKGFYYIALGANIPIVLIGIDYKKKCIYAEKYIIPCGDINKDMKTIKLYFKQFKGKYPEKFDIGNI
ncbi:MAG TPA: acyltransferase, partial [Candidatus Phocaeicola gallistercoris]|nr:acyltransferase [Candidatus Phocaeicola gallistercoris]